MWNCKPGESGPPFFSRPILKVFWFSFDADLLQGFAPCDLQVICSGRRQHNLWTWDRCSCGRLSFTHCEWLGHLVRDGFHSWKECLSTHNSPRLGHIKPNLCQKCSDMTHKSRSSPDMFCHPDWVAWKLDELCLFEAVWIGVKRNYYFSLVYFCHMKIKGKCRLILRGTGPGEQSLLPATFAGTFVGPVRSRENSTNRSNFCRKSKKGCFAEKWWNLVHRSCQEFRNISFASTSRGFVKARLWMTLDIPKSIADKSELYVTVWRGTAGERGRVKKKESITLGWEAVFQGAVLKGMCRVP